MVRKAKKSRKTVSKKSSSKTKSKSRKSSSTTRKKAREPLLKKYQESTRIPISSASVDVIDLQREFDRIDRDIKRNVDASNTLPTYDIKKPVMYLEKPALIKKKK